MDEDDQQVIMTVTKSDEQSETKSETKAKEKSKRKTRKRRQKKQQGGGALIDDWQNMVSKTDTFRRRDDYNILDSLNQDLVVNGNLKISYTNTSGISDNGNDFGIRDPNNFVSPTSLHDIAATVHCITKDLLTQGGATTRGFHAKITEMDNPDPEHGFSDVVSYLNNVENALRGPNSNPVNIKNIDNYPLYIWALAAFVGNVDCVTLKPMLFTETDERKIARNEGEQQQMPLQPIQQMQEPYPTG